MILTRNSFPFARILLLGLVGVGLVGCGRPPAPVPTRPSLPPDVIAPAAQPTDTPLPTAQPTEPAPTPTPTAISPVQGNVLDLIQAFVEAPYRVVAVTQSPLAPYSLIVVTERAAADCGSPEDPQRCTADDTCGSLYTSPTCYFFVEPSFDASAEPATRYVARWPDEPTVSALALDSFRFIDARTVEFQAAGGDGAYSVQEVWWLDLVTGALAMQSRVEQQGGTP